MARTRDSITELQELGQTTTRAGLTTLERLTRTPVKTQDSRVSLVPTGRIADVLHAYVGSEVASRFPFSGTASGVAALFLTRVDAIRLAELLLGSDQGSIKRLGDLEQSTIAETTNIALNGCLNALASKDGVRFDPGVPETTRGVKDLAAFLRPSGADGHTAVVETVFREPSRDITGAMVLVIAIA